MQGKIKPALYIDSTLLIDDWFMTYRGCCFDQEKNCLLEFHQFHRRDRRADDPRPGVHPQHRRDTQDFELCQIQPLAQQFCQVIGLLGKAGLLSMNAHTRETSPTRRGKFVRERLLCQDIPAPPPNVVTTLPEPDPTAATMRDRLKVHATNPVCSSCHGKTDPIGLAFEHFDATARFARPTTATRST